MSRKIGIITEAPRGSGDEKVFRWLAEQFCPGMDPEFIGNRNKKELVADCIDQIELLLSNDQCEKVLVIYDLMPRFQPRLAETPVDPKGNIEQRIQSNGLPLEKIEFICIRQMLETWLIADEAAVRNFYINKHRPNPLPGPFNGGRKQINNPKPKNLIIDYYKEYNPTTNAVGIMKESNLKTVSKRCPSFDQFRQFIVDNC